MQCATRVEHRVWFVKLEQASELQQRRKSGTAARGHLDWRVCEDAYAYKYSQPTTAKSGSDIESAFISVLMGIVALSYIVINTVKL